MPLDATAVLSATRPPGWREALKTSIGRKYFAAGISVSDLMPKLHSIEEELGLAPSRAPRSPFVAQMRLVRLQQEVEDRKAKEAKEAKGRKDSADAAVIAGAMARKPESAPEPAAMLTASLAAFCQMDTAVRLKFSQDGGALAYADFKALSTASKMEHVRNGGRIIPEGATVAPHAIKLVGDATLDAAIVVAGAHSLAHLKAMSEVNQLRAAVASLPPGSMSRKCCEANLAIAETKLQNCE
jgi:hypothetical protein